MDSSASDDPMVNLDTIAAAVDQARIKQAQVAPEIEDPSDDEEVQDRAADEIFRLLQPESPIKEVHAESPSKEDKHLHLAMLNVRSGKYFALKVKEETTAQELACRVELKEKIPVRKINLLHKQIYRIFGGDQEDEKCERSMEQIGVKDGDLIAIVENKDLVVIPKSEWESEKSGSEMKIGKWDGYKTFSRRSL